MTETVGRRDRRLEFLDSARGIAASYVIASHVLTMPSPHLSAPEPVMNAAKFGSSGVVLFFLVSAFSLCYTMPSRLVEKRPVVSFYIHRLMRIAPLFYALIVLTYLARFVQERELAGGFGELLASLLFVFNFVPEWQSGIVIASWTIGVEMLFYLAFPIIYRAFGSLAKALAATVVAVVLWNLVDLLLRETATDRTRAYMDAYSILKHLPVFMLGIAMYYAFAKIRERRDDPSLRPVGTALIVVGLVGLILVAGGWLGGALGVDDWYLMAVFYASVVLGLAITPWRIIVNRFTQFLGKLSYSIYLIHPLVISTIKPVYPRVYDAVSIDTVAFSICLSVTFALTVVASAVSYRLVERPGIAATKRIVARASSPRSGSGR